MPTKRRIFLFYSQKLSLNKLVRLSDANCCFTLIDVVAHGREKDSSVFSNSNFGKAFSSGDLNVPPSTNIPGTSISIPLYFAGDEAFPLKPRT
jgi:hypothetical protein